MDFEIREDRERSRGRRALSRERAAYLRLVQQGLSNKEACRIVGINLRTGRRWRNGRNPTGKDVGALPITSAAPPDVRGVGQYPPRRAVSRVASARDHGRLWS
jgi:hypothetical protein